MEEIHRARYEVGGDGASTPSLGTPPSHRVGVFTNPETL